MVVAQLLLSAVDDDIPRIEEIRMAVKVCVHHFPSSFHVALQEL